MYRFMIFNSSIHLSSLHALLQGWKNTFQKSQQKDVFPSKQVVAVNFHQLQPLKPSNPGCLKKKSTAHPGISRLVYSKHPLGTIISQAISQPTPLRSGVTGPVTRISSPF